MEIINKVLMHVATLPWEAVLATLGGSAVIAAVTQFVKHRMDNKTRAKVLSVVGALSGLLTVIPDALNWLVSNPSWAQLLPANFAWLFTGAVALHAVLSTPPFHKLRILIGQYKQALEQIQAEDNAQSVTPISNPNLTLNQPGASTNVPPTPPAQQEEEKPVLTIQG